MQALTPLEGGREDPVVLVDIECLGPEGTKRLGEQLPRPDAVEELEEQDSEHDVLRRLVALVRDAANEKLTDAIRRPGRVGETVLSNDSVFAPRAGLAPTTPIAHIRS